MAARDATRSNADGDDRHQDDRRRLRVRWAAIGAAVAVSLGAGGLGLTHATLSSGARAVFVPITPCRLIDTRPAPDTVGGRTSPLGPGETLTLQVTGANGNCSIPADASAVAANVVAVAPTAAGFFTLWPSNVVARPLTANLNFVADAPPTPNKVDVQLSPTGKLNVFNFSGSAHLVLDVFGYYVDHDHDDRYLQIGEIVMQHGHTDWRLTGLPSFTVDAVDAYTDGVQVTTSGPGFASMGIDGPASIGGRQYELTEVEFCATSFTGTARVTGYGLSGGAPTPAALQDDVTLLSDGCATITTDASVRAERGVSLYLLLDGTGAVVLTDVTSTWSPAP